MTNEYTLENIKQWRIDESILIEEADRIDWLIAEVERWREVVRDKITEKHSIANNAVHWTGDLKKQIQSLQAELKQVGVRGITGMRKQES